MVILLFGWGGEGKVQNQTEGSKITILGRACNGRLRVRTVKLHEHFDKFNDVILAQKAVGWKACSIHNYAKYLSTMG